MRCLVVFLVLVVGLLTPWGAAQAQEPIRVGVIFSLSGPVAPLGQFGKAGLDLAQEEVKAAGGVNGHPLELIVVNDESKPAQAVNLGLRLVNRDNAVALIGGSFGSTAQALGAFAEKEKVPLVTPTGLVFDEQRQWKYTFFTLPNFNEVAKSMLAWAQKKGVKRVGLLRLSREYGQIGSRYLHDNAARYGVQIVAEEQGTDDGRDFTPQLSRLRDAKPDGLVVWFANPAGATVIKNMRQLGMNVPVVAPLSMANRALVKSGGADVEGVVLEAQIAGGEPTQRSKAFVASYIKKYNEEPGTLEAVGYDMVKMVAAALAKTPPPYTRDKIRDALVGLNYAGAGTVVSYGPGNNEPSPETIVLVEVRNGQFVLAR
jgi:branched-chain amino acid transport system substrate-binding protein